MFSGAKGNKTEKCNKCVTFSNTQYNSLNLPQSIELDNPNVKDRTKYMYTATGVKLQVIHETDMSLQAATVMATAPFNAQAAEVKTTDYIGNKVYENNVLKRILIDGGYIENGVYYYYLTDHLGNNRVVVNSSGTVIQRNHYYPFGMSFADTPLAEQGKQPYKYNGKELDMMHGLNLYDYSARYYEPGIGRFSTVDPLAEVYYHMSPYAYCGNNPIKRTDPTGMAYSSSNPNQWEDLMSHLANGGSLNSFNTNGWEETEDPEPPQDIIPPIYNDVNWVQLAAEEKMRDHYKWVGKTANEAVLKIHPATALFTYISPHAIAVNIQSTTSGGVAVGAGIEGILILQGPHSGTFIVTGNGSIGAGTAHINAGVGGTSYYYMGNLNQFGPETFKGESGYLSVGGELLGKLGLGLSYSPDRRNNGALIGASFSIGVGISATGVSADGGFTITKVIYAKDL